MCYGDIGHGSDGYYQEWAEQRAALEENKKQARSKNVEEVAARELDDSLPF
jgi:hypothetical protein